MSKQLKNALLAFVRRHHPEVVVDREPVYRPEYDEPGYGFMWGAIGYEYGEAFQKFKVLVDTDFEELKESNRRLQHSRTSVPKTAGVYYYRVGSFVKVGHSRKGAGRFSDVSEFLPPGGEFLGFVEGPSRLETLLHKRYSSLWVRGEWFSLDGVLYYDLGGSMRGADPLEVLKR